MPGNRIVAIFGFCDIRNFTDITEILQERVMLFVNSIAYIVHSCGNNKFLILSVHNSHGSANKNIGDAFLLVWNLPSNLIKTTSSYDF